MQDQKIIGKNAMKDLRSRITTNPHWAKIETRATKQNLAGTEIYSTAFEMPCAE